MTESEPRLTVEPAEVLVDEGVRVRVDGLRPLCDVTIVGRIEYRDRVFMSHSHYISDNNGCVDLTQQPSYGGSYTGIEPMGFIWSLKPVEDGKQDIRLIHVDVEEAQVVDLYVLSGQVTVARDETLNQSECLASAQLKRYYKSRDVKQILIREGAVRGALFIPKGPGPFPAVIDMFGGDGGLRTFRAALLASRGFMTLALAYFRYEDLPPDMHIKYEYLLECIDWLYSHPMTRRDSGGIGVVAVSLGGAVAMIMSTISNKIKAVVSINGHSLRMGGVHSHNDVVIPTIRPTQEDLLKYYKRTEEGDVLADSYIPTPQQRQHVLPLEEAADDCSFLFIIGEDDQFIHINHTYHLIERLRNHSRNNYKLLSYPGTGHLIEPPHAPLCRYCHTLMTGGPAVYGGYPKPHARAQERAWPQLQSFLHQKLGSRSGTSEHEKYQREINSKFIIADVFKINFQAK